jgi:hypothetical protein
MDIPAIRKPEVIESRHDEPDARIKLSRMLFHFGDHPARLGPASGLIAEIGMEPAHLVRRSSNRARSR